MKTGVVLELNNGNAVVLDGSGTFRTVVAESGWRPGDVVALPEKRRTPRWTLPLAACLALVLAGSGGWLWLAPAALVSLDVNPSVELTVNRFDRVVSTHAMNAEGAGLLAAGGVKGMTVDGAVATLLDSDYLVPYLEREGYVALTVQSTDGAREEKLLALVDETAEAAVAPGTRVSCHGVDGALVREAHGSGVTAGKYLALLALQEADPQIDIMEYAHCGLGEIEEQIMRCHAAADDSAGEGVPGGMWDGCGMGPGHRHGHGWK